MDEKYIRIEDDYDLLTPTEKRIYLRNKTKERKDDNVLVQEKIGRKINLERWLRNGQLASNQSRSRFNIMKRITYPYQSKMRLFEEFNEIFDRVHEKMLAIRIKRDVLFLRLRDSQRILKMTKFKKAFQKSQLIQEKFHMHCQIRQKKESCPIFKTKALEIMVCIE